MYTISKQFHFSASHELRGLEPGHPCMRVHGHNYVVEVVLQSRALDDRGFVLDYGQLKPFKDYLDKVFDHRHLNEVSAFAETQPSAENLAHHFFSWCKVEWPQTHAVRVSETPKTWAEYREC